MAWAAKSTRKIKQEVACIRYSGYITAMSQLSELCKAFLLRTFSDLCGRPTNRFHVTRAAKRFRLVCAGENSPVLRK